MQQLDLFAEPTPAPDHPGHFYVAGLRVRCGSPAAGPGQGWRSQRLADAPDYWPVSGHAPYTLRQMWETWARAEGLPLDLYVRGWARDARPDYGHWLHWPAGHVSMCLASLELNIAGARQMRPMSEHRARAQAAAAPKKTRRAA